MEQKHKVVVLLSGGLNSTTLLYDLQTQDYDLSPLLVRQGRTHDWELTYGYAHCKKLNLKYEILSLPTTAAFSHTVDHTMFQAPGRWAVLLLHAAQYAWTIGATAIAIAFNQDKERTGEDIQELILAMVRVFGASGLEMQIMTPYLFVSKVDVYRRSLALKIPPESTRSCEHIGPTSCGECLSCRKRRAAIAEAELIKTPLSA